LLARMKRLGISKRERFGIGAEPRSTSTPVMQSQQQA
jgi:hypothetical protein